MIILAGGTNITGYWHPGVSDEEVMTEALKRLGILCYDQHTKDTPTRIIKAYREFLKLGHEEPKFTTFDTEAHDMVLVKDIHFYSLCAHHLLPFFGTAAIAYIPNKKIAGLSKLVRAVNYFSHRLQVQEELTSQIADYLKEKLGTRHVAVVLSCEHLCLSMRGANSPGHQTVTTALRGAFMNRAAVKEEMYKMLELKDG